ncbi:putative NUDIX hydrolase [Anatilimnocola aggregata]|uniref:Putative NUDIX hydrolase n=1 Tax=Anatilimnocola aggregata TaxID=2528021 RepID=A0A517YLX3_9BACT|nr:CoA pyrophosphatase [Anatilimnocola aggregata]QDU31218.1 putative NUDIX hydrolase [Anatilimnocola aggregata]
MNTNIAPLQMSPDQLADYLGERIARGLPGRKSQTPVAPQLSFGRHFGPPAREAREAAVLLLLYPKSSGWHVPAILRPTHMKAHADQVGLPGGMVEAGESSQQSALREYEEELGGPRTGIRVLGELSPLFVFVSNVLVRPHLALCLETPTWQPNPGEVAEVIEVPVAQLLDPTVLGMHQIERRGLIFSAPHYQIGNRRIWGATCMMLAELAALVA